jgi:predicted amidohydrolase YtcJ
MSPEEAVRGYTAWAAHAAFLEMQTGILEPGRWADVTVMDIDPFVVGSTQPGELLDGSIVLTVVGGEVVFKR